MADERDPSVNTPLTTPSTPRVYRTDKENLTHHQETGMKTFSPFAKHTPKSFKILSDDEIRQGKGSSISKPAHQITTNKSKTQIKRKSLATLQQSSEGKGKLTGNGRDTLSIKEAFKRKPESKHNSSKVVDVKISEISTIISTKISSVPEEQILSKEGPCSEKGDELLVNEALDLMKQTENIDDSYWKQIAEERREALEETLTENEKLYDRIDELVEENKKLESKLNEAECFKMLYENLLASKE
uniref:Geminin n=1 Tax=Clytia hemisphaerica TaxID=252671 RepID=A0A7M5VCP2_9CNID